MFGRGRRTSEFDERHGGPGLMFSRNALSAAILAATEAVTGENVKVRFEERVIDVDCETGRVQHQSRPRGATPELWNEGEKGAPAAAGPPVWSEPYDLVIGADGSG